MAQPGSNRTRAAGLALAVAGLLLLFWVLPVADYFHSLLEWLRGLGPIGPVILAAVYAVTTVLMAPGLILTLGAGYAFGLVVGVATVSVGSLLGATGAFLVGRYAARGFVEGLAARNPRFSAIDRAVAESGWKIVLLTRLTPILPFNVLNYLYGATSVRLRDYFFASWIGMLPGTVMYVYLGAAAESLADLASGRVEGGPAQLAFFMVGLVAAIRATVLVTRIARRALAQAADAPLSED